MQKNQQETPKLRNIKRVRNASTPEMTKRTVPDATFTSVRPLTSRRTMAPFDLHSQSIVGRKRSPMGRTSMMPSQVVLDAQRKQDMDSADVELKLLYDEYLRNIMTEIVIKKKTEERKSTLIAQLATIANESDQDKEKLMKLKSRERDIINLTRIQNELDAQIVELNKYISDDTNKTVMEILSQLHSVLKPLDVLSCKNVIVPDTSKEWKEMHETLQKCTSTLERIKELIGTKVDVHKAVNDNLKDFIETHKNIESLQKKLEDALCNLQVRVLKNAAWSLAHRED